MRTQNTAEKRFEFGQNWSEYLKLMDDERILEAEKSLKEMLETDSLKGKKCLDIGSGSGIFSLAARRLGAEVLSFDVDEKSVFCTESLKSKYFKDDSKWKVGFGSVLNEDFVSSLGEFDVVYSWGVLHHTGDMWSALDIASLVVSPSGKLFIAIYNDYQHDRWNDNYDKTYRDPSYDIGTIDESPSIPILGDIADFAWAVGELVTYTAL